MAKNTQELELEVEKEVNTNEKTVAANATVGKTNEKTEKTAAQTKTAANNATVEKNDKNDKTDKTDKAEKASKTGKTDKADKTETNEKVDGKTENANTELATTETAKDETVATTEQKNTEIAKNDKDKKEKELTPEQLAQKLEAEKLAQKKAYKEQKNKFAIENDIELRKKQLIETQNLKKKIIVNGGVGLVGLIGVGVVLLLGIPPYFAALVLPAWAFAGLNIFKSIKTLPKLQSAHELRIMIIIDQARKAHDDKNKQILEAYKAEKQRIKSLKRLPYKILNYVSFFITMFTIILLFFIFDVGITATALVLFAFFTITYFLVGVVMIAVAYMISENKQRESMLRLEEEKNRLLLEERLRSEEVVRVKLEKERKRYEEEERLRIEEQIRAAKEEAERLVREEEERLLIEEERLQIEEAARVKAEIKAEKVRKKAEVAAEKERVRQNMIKESKFMRQQEKLPPPPTKAEIAKDIEVIRNEFDKKMLEEISTRFDGLNISGIEEFIADKDKITKEYAAGITFPDVDLSDAGLEKEMDNSSILTVAKDKEEPTITDFDTTDIEEAKTLVFKNARKMAAKAEDDDFTTEDLVKEVNRTVTQMQTPQTQTQTQTQTQKTQTPKEPAAAAPAEEAPAGKPVSGKGFMMIKQMLKDE